MIKLQHDGEAKRFNAERLPQSEFVKCHLWNFAKLEKQEGGTSGTQDGPLLLYKIWG